MKLNIIIALIAFVGLSVDSGANGRQPCDRGAGGISHCAGKKFVCNDGRISKSHKVCNAKIYGGSK